MQIPPKYQLLYIELRKGILANTTRKQHNNLDQQYSEMER